MKNKLPSAVLFAAFVLFFSMADRFAFCWLEDMGTFFFEKGYVFDALSHPGGVAFLMGQFLVQFFFSPLIGILFTSFLLAVCAEQGGKVLMRTCPASSGFALLPVMALAVLSTEIYYMFSGIVAFALMLLALRLRPARKTVPYDILSAALLYYAAGPVAVIYAVSAFALDAAGGGKFRVAGAAPVAAALLSAAIWFLTGNPGSVRRAIGPEFYLQIHSIPVFCAYLPWILWAMAIMSAFALKKARKHVLWQGIGLGSAAVVLALFFCLHSDKETRTLKALSHFSSNGEWKEVIRICRKSDMTNLAFQNYRNMALAQNGQLLDGMFPASASEPQSLFIETGRNMILSQVRADVDWYACMPASAQHYAFEANQMNGNYSPRFLKRLVETNLVMGFDDVARKYIRLMRGTLFYSEWADRMLAYSNGKYFNPMLDSYRRTVKNLRDGFCQFLGPEADLLEVLSVNPDCYPAFQYMCAGCMLKKNVEGLCAALSLIPSAVPSVMPVNLQQAVICGGDMDFAREIGVQYEVLESFSRFYSNPGQFKYCYWHYYFAK